ncbi:hypothetical protein V1477_018819 [Vespula maculifrons]|uniref:Uncharacterized protein n=1 Tax=Vespula maculifrons TaxID=7453 RepID=A0ABD2AWH8_VESMC
MKQKTMDAMTVVHYEHDTYSFLVPSFSRKYQKCEAIIAMIAVFSWSIISRLDIEYNKKKKKDHQINFILLSNRNYVENPTEITTVLKHEGRLVYLANRNYKFIVLP